MSESVPSCIICLKEITEKSDEGDVTRVGLLSLINYASSCQPEIQSRFEKLLPSKEIKKTAHKIHRSCQRSTYNALRKRKKETTEESTSNKRPTRSTVPEFDWKNCCLFCGEKCGDADERDLPYHSKRHPDRSTPAEKYHRCRYKEFRDAVLQKCRTRHDDEARAIERRALSCSDFVAAEARYHGNCRDLFNGKCRRTLNHEAKGRPVKEMEMKHFNDLCEWIENEGELYTLSELQEKLKEISGCSEVYSTRSIQRKLVEKYGSNIYISHVNGRRNVVCLKDVAEFLINDMWYQNRKIDAQEESERIIRLAAKLIVSDIRAEGFDKDFYPGNKTIASLDENLNFLPKKLKLFMECCISQKLKQASIGQCIIHASRPRGSIPPILFGHAVDLDHVFGSRWVIDEECRLGFCVSSNEVTRFKQSVLTNEDTDTWLSRYLNGTFYHWIADNVDHNSKTLDGKGVLHAMGIVVTATGSRASYRDLPRVVRQKIAKVDDLVKNKGIPLLSYFKPDISGLSKIIFKPIDELKTPFFSPDTANINLLWHASHFFKKLRPGWSGFMSDVTTGNHDGKADITMLPIINMDPTDMSCVYSTLMFINDQAKKLNVDTPCVTFDQPLWLKASEIVQEKSLRMVLILGGFHTMMSFCGSIGELMDGSGLEDCFQTVYGSATVSKMLQGKAISRALRAHFLTEASLTSLLLSSIFPEISSDEDADEEKTFVEKENLGEISDENLQENSEEIHVMVQEEKSVIVEAESEIEIDEENEEEEKTEDIFEQSDVISDLCTDEGLRQLSKEEVRELKRIYECIEENYEEGMEHLRNSETFNILIKMLHNLKLQLSAHSKTAKLWLEYLKYINILKQFIRAERCGDWGMHLDALENMLNLFAATGHIHYAKSARLHLQEMRELKTKHPFVYKCFKEKGYHTVRRSDKYWAGLWTDLTIEQVLMRSIKSRGGLTRGRGITESVRAIWLGSMHRRSAVHDAMSSLSQVFRSGGEQHVELGKSRRERDAKDLHIFTSFLESHNPFDTTSNVLRSISSGFVAREEDGINCEDAENVGKDIQKKLDNISFESASIKRSEKIRNLSQLRETVQVQDEKVHIDPLVLFGRLSILVQNQDEAAELFKYELTHEPPALFKNGLMRKPNKSALRQKLVKDSLNCSNPSQITVVDGGALLYHVSWLPDSTYSDIANQYSDYVMKKYGDSEKVLVIFDGYDDPLSTKSNEHTRRGQLRSADVDVGDGSLQVRTTRKLFLKNFNNKKQLISILTRKFIQAGIEVNNSKGDADILIVLRAIDAAHQRSVRVMSDDTDVLVMLLFHWDTMMKDIKFCTTKTVNRKKVPINYSVKSIVRRHSSLVKQLLFAHAWTGCDSTSATHKQGKNRIFKLLKTKKAQSSVSCFGDVFATQEVIGEAGVKFFIKW